MPLKFNKAAAFGKPSSIGWAVRNWLPLDGLVIVFGEFSTGKSTVVLSLLAVLASLRGLQVDEDGSQVSTLHDPEYPTEFLGLPARSNLNCVYLMIERRPDFANRREAARIGFGLAKYPRAVDVSTGLLNLGKDAEIEALVEHFDERYCPSDEEDPDTVTTVADVVALDTVSSAMPGLSENLHEGISRVNLLADLIREKRPCLFIAITHTPKNGEDVRGHNALPGHADVILKLTADDDGIMTLSQEKNNLALHQPSIRFRKEIVEVARDKNGVPVTAWYPVLIDEKAGDSARSPSELNPSDRQALDVLRGLPPRPTKTEWKKACVSAGMAETTAGRAIDRLSASDGPVVLRENRYYLKETV